MFNIQMNLIVYLIVGRCPVSKNASAVYSFVWAEEIPSAAQRQRRAFKEHGSLHQGTAVCPTPDKWYVLNAFK